MNGKFIVFEGLDGSGKATQAKAFFDSISEKGIKAKKISFPDYNSQSSALVKMYLAGEVGSLDEVNVYAASNFYSLDRYISYMREWKENYLGGEVIIADRYTTSNICHQMSKLPKEEWAGYIEWLEHYEYVMLGLPKPDVVVYLDMPPEASQKLMTERYKGDESKKDIHESNMKYLLKCRESALFAAEKLGWQVICCADENNDPLSIEAIAKMTLQKAEKMVFPEK